VLSVQFGFISFQVGSGRERQSYSHVSLHHRWWCYVVE